jgi:DNA-directed RNA polymerase subunit H (RpoH/RPB5)
MSLSQSVEYNLNDKTRVIVTNILKMLERRGLIKSSEDILKKLDLTSEIIKFDKTSIYILEAKITSVNSNSSLSSYLSTNLDHHKIIILDEINKKLISQILSNKNTEFFLKHEMMIDIESVIFVPKHILLNDDEKKEYLTKFNDTDLSKIFNTDIMSRYYGAKVGDIFKIIRPSITAGKNIFFRKVINGSWDVLFPKNN